MPKLMKKSRQPPDSQIFSVSEFTRRVRTLLEREMPEVWVRGEISNFRRQASGHCYFSLKDAGSQLSTVLFKSNAAQTPLALRDGLQVIAFGRVTVYEPRGNYQLIVHYLIEDGLGRLQQDLERLKRKLSGEGLFDPERKKALPLLPAAVGFITSPHGGRSSRFYQHFAPARMAGPPDCPAGKGAGRGGCKRNYGHGWKRSIIGLHRSVGGRAGRRQHRGPLAIQ